MKKNLKYLIAFFVLLFVEIMIALFVHDDFIRPYIGDVLVVILMYTIIRGITKKQIKLLPIYLFIFSASVEVSQYFHLVNILNLQDNRILSIIIGNSFDIKDIFCYLAGTLILLAWEYFERVTSQ